MNPMLMALAFSGGGGGLLGGGTNDQASNSAGGSNSNLGLLALLGGMGGGMGGMGGLGGMGGAPGKGVDPMTLMAMSQQGNAGGVTDLLKSQMFGGQSDLFANLLGGEGSKDPSQGMLNLQAEGLIDDMDDLDEDGEPDHLVETRNKIDDYLAKQWLLGKRKLTVSVNYGNMPLEYQYLNQYHGFPNPLAG